MPKDNAPRLLYSGIYQPFVDSNHNPVSYTHLDVYKRQFHYYEWANDNLWTFLGLDPVSYTHLDVYKRQVSDSASSQ